MVWASVCAAEEGIKATWSRRLEQLKSNHMEEYNELKERHNDKVERLLSKLSDANLKYVFLCFYFLSKLNNIIYGSVC